MTVGHALRLALGDFYRQSWRLALLNTALSAVVVPVVLLAVFAPPALVLLVLAGLPAAALAHGAVTLAQTEDLRLGDAVVGARRDWRRGLGLAALVWGAFALGILALSFYGGGGPWTWPLAVAVFYVLILVVLIQLWAWPLLAYAPDRSLRGVLADAARGLAGRPGASAGLAAALLVVNVVGAAAAAMPLLTLTVAYSFLAAAHFALPRSPIREGVA